jgi:hypothetical protein
VPIRTFANEASALIAQAALRANGIEAVISRDDAGGMEPQLQLTRGVRLLVSKRDLERALAVLDVGPL